MQLIRELGLPPETSRTHVGFMGCHGALNGLRVARATQMWIPMPGALCAVELCSIHDQYGWNPEHIVANALFATVPRPSFACTSQLHRKPTEGCTLWPLRRWSSRSTEDMMSWRIGDHGLQMGLSPQVPDVIKATLRAWMKSWLATFGYGVEDVGEWAIHPGGPRILPACLDALDLGPDAIATSKAVLAEFGNMSSPTILLIVERLMRQSATGPWVLLAFGPGLPSKRPGRAASQSGPLR